jgi:hypothetical protein
MASSFITFKEKGFWANDSYVEVFQLLLFEETHNISNSNWLTEYRKDLALESLPLISGGMSMCFDKIIINNERKEKILEFISTIKSKIKSDQNYLTGNHLNHLRKAVRLHLLAIKEFDWDKIEIDKQLKEGAFSNDLPIEVYQRGLDLLEQVVLENLNYTSSSEITYLN